MTRNFSRNHFSLVNFPSQVSNMRSSSFRCVLNCLIHNEYGLFPDSFRFWPLWLKNSTSATWGYFSALYDKIMKQGPGFFVCLCKDTVPTRYWLKLLCFLQSKESGVDSAICPQDILQICRDKTPMSDREKTFVSLLDGFELHGNRKTKEIVLT